MTKINLLFGSLAFSAAMLGINPTSAVAADVNIIPIPVKTQTLKGEFVLPQKVVIAYQTTEGKNIAQYMADKLKASTGYEVRLSDKKGNITIQITPSLKMAEEGYRLSVTAKGVTIKAKTAKGAFYGMQSFMQLLPAQVESATKVDGVKWVAQCCNIEDAPRFGYRGFHLDPCRHFITVENVKKQLDLMSMFKVNTMHFHLTEDQGWRIEIKKYPKLTTIGSIRTEGDGSSYGGYYTQEQIKEIVDYAAKRRFSRIFLPLRISPTENGDSQSKLTMLFCEPIGRTSRLGHLRISRYRPTVVILRPGTKNMVSPPAMRYENGKLRVLGWCIS